MLFEQRANSSFLRDEFNNFLFAAICSEHHGRALSVVSLLARLDLDPWTKAAGFSRMPRRIAINELSKMIAGLPENMIMNETPNVAATRLVDLLPASNSPKPARLSNWRNIIDKCCAAFIS